MTLHLYFARKFLASFAGVLTVFALLSFILGLVDQIRSFEGPEVTFAVLVRLTLLELPESLYRILPLIVILATLAMFLQMARTSELVVARAAGRSALRSLYSPVTCAVLIGAASVAVLNPMVAATSKTYERLADRYSGGISSTLSVSREGLWLRQGTEEGQTVIRAVHANLDGTELLGVTFFGFDAGGRPSYRIEASKAHLETGAWVIDDAKEWRFGDTNDNPEKTAFVAPRLSLASNLTRDQILDSFGTPSAIPIWELPTFISGLEDAGFSALAHRTWYNMELATPLLLAAMVLIGAGFTMRHTRFGRTGLMVLLALCLGFSLFFIRNFASILGENGQIPVMLAAWGPPIASVLLPLGLLLHLEDG